MGRPKGCKSNGTTSPTFGDNGFAVTADDWTQRQQITRKLFDLPAVDRDNPDQVNERIGFYFDFCTDNGLRPLVSGLALALGVTRQTLYNWTTNTVNINPVTFDTVKKAIDYIAFLMDDLAFNGKVNPVTWIFYAKNYYGMRDAQEVQLSTPQTALDNIDSGEDLQRLLPDKSSDNAD